MAKKRAAKKPANPKSSKKQETLKIPEVAISKIRLLNSNSSLEVAGRELPSKAIANVSVRGLFKSNEHGAVTIRMLVDATCTVVAPENENTKLEVRCTHEVQYASRTEPTEDLMGSLAPAAAHLAWPYVREYVQSHTAKMGVPGILLPLMVITDKRELLFIQTADSPNISTDDSD